MHPNSLFFIHHNSKYRICESSNSPSIQTWSHYNNGERFFRRWKEKKLLNLKPKKSHSAPGFRILTLKNFLYRPMGRFDICFGGLKTQWQTQRVQPWDYWLHITVDQHIVIKKMRYICLFVFHQNTVCTIQVLFDFLTDFQFKNCDLISISSMQYETKLEGIRIQHSHFYQFALLDFFSEG